MNTIHPHPNESSEGMPPVLRFSTDVFPERERLEAWREFYGRGLLTLDMESLDDTLHSEATLRALPGVRTVDGTGTSMTFDRPARLIDNDDAMLAIVLSQQVRFTWRDREATLHAGDAVLMGAGEGGLAVAASGCRFLSLLMPLAAVAPAGRGAGDLLCRTIPAQTPALRLLTGYLGLLDDEQALATPELQRHVATHVHDLASLVLGANGDTAEVANGRGRRAARLRAIKQDIVGSLARGGVSVAAIAARHRVTPRYVQMLFDEEGTTFTDFVLRQRLAHVHRMLTDPRHARQKIAVLAYDAGFNDPSYFVRCFRRQYGVAPSEVRASARQAFAQTDRTIQ